MPRAPPSGWIEETDGGAVLSTNISITLGLETPALETVTTKDLGLTSKPAGMTA